MTQWDGLAKDYGLHVLTQRDILWPYLTKILTPQFEGRKVLDVGCGTGMYTHFFHKHGSNITGIDSSNKMIESARKNFSGPQYKYARMQDFVSQEKFDYLFANMVVCSVPEFRKLQEFFESVRNVSREGASFFVTNVDVDSREVINTRYLKHDYPKNIDNGVAFNTILGTEDGKEIGPFINYFWDSSALEQAANKGKWDLVSRCVIEPRSTIKEPYPRYLLYEFHRR